MSSAGGSISSYIGGKAALVVAAVALGAAAFVLPGVTGDGGGGGALTANLWQQDGGGACARSSTPVTYANRLSGGDHLCEDSNTAYAAANGGDTVGLKEPVETVFIHSQTTKGSNVSRVTFKPDTGDTVRVSDLDIQGNDNITVQDIQFIGNPLGGWGIKQADNITYLRITQFGSSSSGGGINGDTNNVAIIDTDIGPIDPVDGIGLNDQFGQNNNVLISGVTIHDLTIDSNPAAHDDCMQVEAANGLIIERSKFISCGIEGLFISDNGTPVSNVTIRNNFFGTTPLGSHVLRIPTSGGPSNVLIQNNSFFGHIALDSGLTNIDFVGNIIAGNDADCATEAANADDFDYNVTTAACTGATNNTVVAGIASQWLSTSESPYTAFDLHLTGASALGKGKPGVAGTDFPSTDYDGDARTSPPDAGADEAP